MRDISLSHEYYSTRVIYEDFNLSAFKLYVQIHFSILKFYFQMNRMSNIDQLPSNFVKTFIRHVKVLRFVGLDIFHDTNTTYAKNYVKFFVFNFFFLPLITNQVMYVSLGSEIGASFLEVANAVPTMLMVLQDLVKMIVVFCKRSSIREVFVGMAEVWPTSVQSDKNEKTFSKGLRRLKIIDDAFVTVSFIAVNNYMLSPYLKTIYNIYKNPEDFHYQYPLQLYMLQFVQNHWFYTIGYLYIYLTGIMIHTALYICCDFLLVILTFNLSTLLLLLQNDLEDAVASYEDDEESLQRVKAVVARHQKLLWLADELNNIFGLLIFVQVSFTSIIICCFGFIAVFAEGMLLYNLLASLGVIFAIWNLCWPGQLLTDNVSRYLCVYLYQCFGISEAAYRSVWYDKDLKLRRYILIIMNRAQNPCYLTALGFSNLTLVNLAKILSTSWSYLSLLNNMYGNLET